MRRCVKSISHGYSGTCKSRAGTGRVREQGHCEILASYPQPRGSPVHTRRPFKPTRGERGEGSYSYSACMTWHFLENQAIGLPPTNMRHSKPDCAGHAKAWSKVSKLLGGEVLLSEGVDESEHSSPLKCYPLLNEYTLNHIVNLLSRRASD